MTEMDIRLIPEYDGASAISVVEWLDKVELVCKLRDIECLEEVIPLRLTGGAFSVYQQLDDEKKQDAASIKEALIAAFEHDSFMAYDTFIARRLEPNETVDVYLADLKRLASLFGGVSEAALGCAFVSGLPHSARQILRSGSRMETMSLCQLLTRARAVLADEATGGAAVTRRANEPTSYDSRTAAFESGKMNNHGQVLCFKCNGPNHLARDCLSGTKKRGAGKRLTTNRQGNGRGEEAPAPAFSPASH